MDATLPFDPTIPVAVTSPLDPVREESIGRSGGNRVCGLFHQARFSRDVVANHATSAARQFVCMRVENSKRVNL